MYRAVPSAILFYRQHPISEDQVLDALRRQGKDLGKLSPQDLYHWDQDHYGGLAAVEALTRRAGISAESHVLDVCAGLAGPARFMASQCAARVTCVDLSPERPAGARRLTALVGLGRLVRVVRADAQSLPFPRATLERHSQAAARDVPRPPRPDRGAAGGAALRRVQPALRVLRRACGVGQARRRALQRNSRSRNLLTASGSLTWTPTGTARNDPALPVTWARNWPALWLMSTIMSVRSSARA